MERNLPPNWWSRAAADAEFLLNRFPPISTDAAIPIDGDRYRPIELFTDGLTDGGSAGAGGPAAVVARAMAGNYDQMGSIYCRAAVCRALPYEWFAYRVVIL